MRHPWKNAAHLEKWCTLGNRATLRKMRHTWKLRHSSKNAPHLAWKTHLEKCAIPSENAPHLEKCGTLGRMRHTWTLRHSSKNTPYMKKCATLGNVRHTWENAPQLENTPLLKKKCGTLGKMRLSVNLSQFFCRQSVIFSSFCR